MNNPMQAIESSTHKRKLYMIFDRMIRCGSRREYR